MANDEAVLESVTPILQVRDMAESVEWYQTVEKVKRAPCGRAAAYRGN
jgi:hypothetical protein